MIHWRDEGVIIRYARHGESSAIIEVFTRDHGRHLGVVRGGASRKIAPGLQAGNQVVIEYSARLETHLGSYRVDNGRSYLPRLMAEPLLMGGFNAMAALLRFGMEERDAHRNLYQSLIDWFDSEDWLGDYVRWELGLLREAGFALDLAQCAVTGVQDDLCYVSPKSGRAISQSAAGEWADRLLPYSELFASGRGDNRYAVKQALETTGYFLQNWLGGMVGKHELPEARGRFIDQL